MYISKNWSQTNNHIIKLQGREPVRVCVRNHENVHYTALKEQLFSVVKFIILLCKDMGGPQK